MKTLNTKDQESSGTPLTEIEQLRQAIGLATTLHPQMTMRPDDPIGMMKQLEAYVCNLEDALKQKSDNIQAIELLRTVFPKMKVDTDDLMEIARWVVEEVDVLRKIVNKESDESPNKVKGD